MHCNCMQFPSFPSTEDVPGFVPDKTVFDANAAEGKLIIV